MFFAMPIGDENKYKGIPYVTYSIFAVNVFIYLLYTLPMNPLEYYALIQNYGFNGAHPKMAALVTSTFFHADFWHLLFNMVFLLVFADNVEILLGPVVYAVMYLTWGAVACVAQALIAPFSDAPMIGASGAIAGVLGAYVYLMPKNRVKIFYWLYATVDILLIKSIWVVGVWFFLQVIYYLTISASGFREGGGVAYMAHIGGFLLGVGSAALIVQFESVRLRLKHMDEFMPESAGNAEDGESGEGTQRRSALAADTPAASEQVADAGGLIRKLVNDGKYSAACSEYEADCRTGRPDDVSAEAMILVGDAYYRQGLHKQAARVYESALKRIPDGPERSHALHNLGIISSRQLNQPDRAVILLKDALKNPADQGHRLEAMHELIMIDRALRDLASRGGSGYKKYGKYAVMLRSQGKYNTPEAGRIAARVLGVPISDVTGLIAASGGIIVQNVFGEQAEKIMKGLLAAGMDAVSVPQGDLVSLPKSEEYSVAIFTMEGLLYRDADRGERVLPWSEILSINACAVETGGTPMPVMPFSSGPRLGVPEKDPEQKREDFARKLLTTDPADEVGPVEAVAGAVSGLIESASVVGGLPMDGSGGESAGLSFASRRRLEPKKVSVFLDVITSGAKRRLVFEDRNFLCKLFPEGKIRSFREFAKDALEFGGSVHISDALRIYAARTTGWSRYTFSGTRQFDLHSLREAQIALMEKK